MSEQLPESPDAEAFPDSLDPVNADAPESVNSDDPQSVNADSPAPAIPELPDEPDAPEAPRQGGMPATRVKIIGVGGGGVNSVEGLMSGGLLSAETVMNAEFAAVNTDAQALETSPVPERLVIGRAQTRGLGAGGEAERGRAAAEADRAAIDALVSGVDLVVLLVALGGGTGSGAAPVIAKAAAESGAMVISFVTLPFSWEGDRRTRQAHEAIDRLRAECEAVIPMHNDMLLQGEGADAPVEAAFNRANAWVCSGLNALCGMLFKRGLINIDFATLRSALPVRGGRTLFSVASAEGDDRFRLVLERLMDCPLLYTKDAVRTADTLVVNIVGGAGLSLARVNEILSAVKGRFGGRENTVLGAVIDDSHSDFVEVCVLGSAGIARKINAPRPRRPSAELRSAPKAEDPEGSIGETDILAAEESAAASEVDPAKLAVVAEGDAQKGAKPRAGAPAQTEIAFDEPGDFFADSHTRIDGQDIDLPTFLRRHIRIRL